MFQVAPTGETKVVQEEMTVMMMTIANVLNYEKDCL